MENSNSSSNSSSAPVSNADVSNTPNVAESNAAESAQAKATAEAIKKFKVKVDGEELEVDEQELLTGYQTRKSADKKFREAAMRTKQAEEFINLLRTNPIKILTDPKLGIDAQKLMEEYLAERYSEELLSPEQRELKQAKAQLAEIEAEKKRQEDARMEEERQALVEKHTADYQNQIMSALDSSGLPKTEHTVKRMAYYMSQALKRGYDLKAADVVDLVKQDYIQETKSLYGSLDGQMLLDLLGEDVAGKIRKYDVSRIKSAEKVLSTPSKQPTPDPERPSSKKQYLSKDEWKAKMEKLKNGEE